MKRISFLGNSLENLRSFPSQVKQQAGYELHRVQNGMMPTDFKTMSNIGKGVVEIRLKDETGIFRVIYTAKISDVVYVLHSFQKKTQKTAKPDLELAKKRYQALTQELKNG